MDGISEGTAVAWSQLRPNWADISASHAAAVSNDDDPIQGGGQGAAGSSQDHLGHRPTQPLRPPPKAYGTAIKGSKGKRPEVSTSGKGSAGPRHYLDGDVNGQRTGSGVMIWHDERLGDPQSSPSGFKFTVGDIPPGPPRKWP